MTCLFWSVPSVEFYGCMRAPLLFYASVIHAVGLQLWRTCRFKGDFHDTTMRFSASVVMPAMDLPSVDFLIGEPLGTNGNVGLRKADVQSHVIGGSTFTVQRSPTSFANTCLWQWKFIFAPQISERPHLGPTTVLISSFTSPLPPHCLLHHVSACLFPALCKLLRSCTHSEPIDPHSPPVKILRRQSNSSSAISS
jgi:hypothetical protein